LAVAAEEQDLWPHAGQPGTLVWLVALILERRRLRVVSAVVEAVVL